jgi:hypothetical protein
MPLSARKDGPPRPAAVACGGLEKPGKLQGTPFAPLESPHNLSFAQNRYFGRPRRYCRFAPGRRGQTKGGIKGCADSALLSFCKASFLSFAKSQCGIWLFRLPQGLFIAPARPLLIVFSCRNPPPQWNSLSLHGARILPFSRFFIVYSCEIDLTGSPTIDDLRLTLIISPLKKCCDRCP